MNWYLQGGNDQDVVKSIRIRFLRNLGGFKFNLNKKEDIEKIENKVKDNLYQIGYGLKLLKLADMDDITKMSLVEKNLISPDFALKKAKTGSILINDEENICIMIGGKEHLCLQVFSSEMDLENTLDLAIELDEKIGNCLGYAINKKYGYLTSTLNDVGTGLKVSVMLHLPALSKTKNIRKILEAVDGFGMNIRGIYGENVGTQEYMYQISNKQTLGITEKEIVKNVQIISKQIIEQERQARKLLTKDPLELEDMIYRSYGILINAKKITYEESKELLSNIKLGVDMGILQELTDQKVKELYLYTKPANLQKYLGVQCDAIECDLKRAEAVKKIINK